MRLSYFRRMQFHVGQSEVLMEERLSERFPRWLVRRCLEDGIRTLGTYGRGKWDLGVRRELLFWRHAGQLVETVRRIHRMRASTGNGE